MTAKDLHFSFDTALAQAQTRSNTEGIRSQASATAPEPANLAQLPPIRPTKTRPRKTGDTSAQRAWITASLISLINMTFLVVAALWLTGNTYEVPGLEFMGARIAEPLILEDLKPIESGLNQNTMQLSELNAALAAQAEMLAAIQAQLAAPEAGAVNTEEAPSPLTTEADVAAVEDWQINLGSFPSAEGATRLQAQLASLGYAAQVGRPDRQGETAYRVWLGGYENREAADTAAHHLMEQTSLTGLWVWNGR